MVAVKPYKGPSQSISGCICAAGLERVRGTLLPNGMHIKSKSRAKQKDIAVKILDENPKVVAVLRGLYLLNSGLKFAKALLHEAIQDQANIC